jgi:putative ABC transport system permease protein
MLEQVVRDIRFAARTLWRKPAFALFAVLTLGLGIGANTAIFSVIYGVLLKPLPYADSDRLVLIRQSALPAGRPDVGVSIKEFFTYRDQAGDFDGLVEFHQMTFDLLKRGEPDRVDTGVVSPNFFEVLGIAPILGRSFVPADDVPGAPAVLILSYSYWQSRFGGDPSIVGQIFEMNDRPHTVIGVLPNVPHYPRENDVYMPTSACPFRADAQTRMAQNPRGFSILNVFGRLKPDVTRERAAAGVNTILGRFVADDAGAYRPGSGYAATALDVRAEMTKNARPMLVLLLATTALILLIACANVANLTLARVLSRDREFAVRASLGADRGRLVRQLLTESTLLAVAGGACGLLFASWTTGMLTAFVGRFTPRTGEVRLDLGVLLFTTVISLATGLLFGLAPALASRGDLAGAVKHGGRGATAGGGRRRLQSALVVAQVAVSVVLLVGAGLLIASFYRLQAVDPGYDGDRVMSAELFPNFSKYPNADAQRRMYLPLIERLQSQPGVLSVAVTNAVPLRATQPGAVPVQIEGLVEDNPERTPTADVRVASPDFFQTLGVGLAAGRVFADSDAADSMRVVVINRAMARYWNQREAIGSRLSLDSGRAWATVIGIVEDTRQFGLDKEPVPQLYLPLRQTPQVLNGLVLVRTSGDPNSAATLIREATWAIDPEMPVQNVRTLDEIRNSYLATPKLTAVLLSIFALLALIVTMAGIAGVMATSVSERTQEFGIRMALGATRPAVLRMVLANGLSLVALGVVIGVVAATAASRVLTSYLFETQPLDPLTFVFVTAAFVAAAAAACCGPAWRATTIDPMVALRAE